MHKINKTRLLAGLPIDASYERRSFISHDERTTQQPTPAPAPVVIKTTEEMIAESIGDISSLSLKQITTIADILGSKLDEIHALIASTLNESTTYKKGASVEDRTGQCFRIIKVVGMDDNDEPVYEVVCPKTGEISKKSNMELRTPTKQTESVEAVNEQSRVDVIDFSNSPEQAKTPAVVVPQPQKTKVPAHVTKDLRAAIASFKKDANAMKHDEANAMFHLQIADAMERLEVLMKDDIKQAQIFLSSLMGPVLHKIPSSVCKFIHTGGDKSLKSYFNK